MLPEILASSELAAIVPRNPALRFARQYPLALVESTLGLEPLKVRLHWYWRVHNDPGLRWLRETMATIHGDAAGRRRRSP